MNLICQNTIFIHRNFGAQSSKGDKGDTGPQGPAGPAGSGGSGDGDCLWQEVGDGRIYYVTSNVGIFTNNPQYPLHVSGDVFAPRFFTGVDDYIGQGKKGRLLISSGQQIELHIDSNDSGPDWVNVVAGLYHPKEIMRIMSTGFVGIGTSDPLAELDMGYNGGIRLGGVTRYTWPSGGGDSLWSLGVFNNVYRPAGNVGIGVANPTETLEVSGSIKMRGTPTKGECTPERAGTMVYEALNNVGTFYGCRQVDATTFTWASLQCGPCNTPSDCGPCEGKVTELTLQYNGTTAKSIKVKQKNGEIIFQETVQPGAQFNFIGTDRGTLGTEITLYENYSNETKIHTSCSQPIGPGLVAGNYLVISGYSLHGGPLCQVGW